MIAKVHIGKGIFTTSEIAKILDISRSKARYWVDNMTSKFKDNAGYSFSWGNNDKTINFYALIELYVFQKLRELVDRELNNG